MIPLAVPNLTGNEKKYLDDCIDTSYVSSVGEYVTKLEKMVADATGSKYAVATSSGTTGLHAMLTAAGVKAGELVMVPTFTFIASANAISHCGAVPWLMDIKISDWCMDVDIVSSELKNNCIIKDGKVIHIGTGRRVAAIMPVYTLGNVPDINNFREIAENYCIPLVVDAACAIGATWCDVSFGGLADASVISFNGNKTVTCGGGGMVVGNDEKLMERIRHLTMTARVGTEYDFDMVGFNYRMTNLQAAVGCAQMEQLGEFIRRKREIRRFYAVALNDIRDMGFSFFPQTLGGSCWLSGIVLPERKGLDEVRMLSLKLRERGIESRTFWKPVHLQFPYQNVPYSLREVSENLWNRIITLPCSTNISDEELEYVEKSVRDIIKSNAS